MKQLIALLYILFLSLGVSAQDFPTPMTPPRIVNDFTNLFTSQQPQML